MSEFKRARMPLHEMVGKKKKKKTPTVSEREMRESFAGGYKVPGISPRLAEEAEAKKKADKAIAEEKGVQANVDAFAAETKPYSPDWQTGPQKSEKDEFASQFPQHTYPTDPGDMGEAEMDESLKKMKFVAGKLPKHDKARFEADVKKFRDTYAKNKHKANLGEFFEKLAANLVRFAAANQGGASVATAAYKGSDWEREHDRLFADLQANLARTEREASKSEAKVERAADKEAMREEKFKSEKKQLRNQLQSLRMWKNSFAQTAEKANAQNKEASERMRLMWRQAKTANDAVKAKQIQDSEKTRVKAHEGRKKAFSAIGTILGDPKLDPEQKAKKLIAHKDLAPYAISRTNVDVLLKVIEDQGGWGPFSGSGGEDPEDFKALLKTLNTYIVPYEYGTLEFDGTGNPNDGTLWKPKGSWKKT